MNLITFATAEIENQFHCGSFHAVLKSCAQWNVKFNQTVSQLFITDSGSDIRVALLPETIKFTVSAGKLNHTPA